jgi:transposase
MRKSRFSDEQMVAILREADRTSVTEAAKRNKVSEQTIYTWRKHFNGLQPSDVKRLKALEVENAKLKRLLGRARPRAGHRARGEPKKMVSPQARREQVAFVCQRGLSRRRAGGLIGIARSSLSYELRMPGKDAPGDRGNEAAVIAVSQAILKWLTESRIETALIDPGKPWQNSTNESFNGKFRDECLSLEWFRTRREGKILIESWRQHYNGVRPHMSLNYLTPIEFKQQHRSTPIHQPRAIPQE